MRVKGNVKRSINRIATAVLGMQMLVGLAAVPALAAGKSQTLTGEVSDAMCGAKHEMQGKAAECTRVCMKHGSQYALVVGDKVYTLTTSDKAALDKLNDLAGAKAKVTGEVDGTTIAVNSVAAGS
jgi:Cu/Ag efflux protein CusF